MPSDYEKAAVMSELLFHAKHGARAESIIAKAYEWRQGLVEALMGELLKGSSATDAISITINKMEGAYSGAD